MPPSSKVTALLQNMRRGFEQLKADPNSLLTSHPHPLIIDIDLPSEILIAVFSLLRLRDILVCRRVSAVLPVWNRSDAVMQVSRSFRHIIDNVPEIQYIIELQIAGLTTTARDSDFGHEEKIQALREIQARQARKHVIENTGLPVHEPLGERSGDVFCHPYSTPTNRDNDFFNALRCVSILSGGLERTIVRRWNLTFHAGFRYFCADSEQDLLVLVRPTGLMTELPESFRRVWVSP